MKLNKSDSDDFLFMIRKLENEIYQLKTAESSKINFFMSDLDKVIHRQVRENQMTTAAAVGCLVIKVLEIWKDAQDLEND